MTVASVEPRRLVGTVVAPPSKSYTHRALVAAYLTRGVTRIEGPLDAEDTRRTAEGLRALGARVDLGPGRWVVRPGTGSTRAPVRIECGESGTTLRFLAALAATRRGPVELRGAPGLGRRPIRPLLDALKAAGAVVEPAPAGGPWGLQITGPLVPSSVRLDPTASSQFLSALLLVLPSLAGPSRVRLSASEVSAPYIAATRATLRAFGVRVHRRGASYHVPAPQRYRASGFRVPGDASSAAYFWAGAALSDGDVLVQGVPAGWPQADRAILHVLARAGARVTVSRSGTRVRGGRLRGFAADLTASPDLYPLLGAVAAVTPGTSRLLGAAHVVHKESDRREGTVRLARALGASVRARSDGLEIRGRRPARRLHLTGLHDHRMIMSASVAALAADGRSVLGDATAVEKSYPGYWRAFASLHDGREGVE